MLILHLECKLRCAVWFFHSHPVQSHKDLCLEKSGKYGFDGQSGSEQILSANQSRCAIQSVLSNLLCRSPSPTIGSIFSSPPDLA